MAEFQVGGVTLSDTEYDQIDIAASWEAVQSFCGWHVAPVQSETLTLDGRGDPILMLPTQRVVNVTKVLVDGEDVTSAIEWSEKGYIRYASAWHVFPDRYRCVEVTLEHGYDKMPASLLAVVKDRAENAETGPKQLMAGPFLEINDSGNTGGLVGYSASAAAAMDRYRLGALPS